MEKNNNKKNNNKNNRRRNNQGVKCSFCDNTSNNSKIYTRKNYPHGRKSKAVVTRMCSRCKYPERAEESDKILAKVMELKLKKENKDGRK